MSETVILVDENDRQTGEAEKLAAHRRNLRHRAISVIVFDRDGRMLLQQRGAAKYHSGGLWSNACCSHPRPGETTAEAAARRIREEMGFTCPLAFAGIAAYQADVGNGLFENEIVHVYVGRHDGPVAPDPEEAAGFAWETPEAVRADIAARPERYTAWFKLYAEAEWFDAPVAGD